MADRRKIKTRVRRISPKLDDLLMKISKKNDMPMIQAGDLVADVVIRKAEKKKMIENIRREIEF